jgi:hypothetical protein
MSNTKFKKVKLTAEKVRCAKCVNCINNPCRLRIDDPKVEDWEKFGCRSCYVERMQGKSDIMLTRIETIESLRRMIIERYNKTFLTMSEGYDQNDWISINSARHDILRWFFPALKSVMDAKSLEELGAMKKQYDTEYFGKEVE